MTNNPLNLRTDIRRIFAAVLVLLVVGLFIVVGQQWTTGKPGTASLWAFGFLGLGTLIGFLFGIPKVLQGDGTAVTTTTTTAGPVQTRHQVNTNLEQVSDWITKILVGLGLVQLGRMPDRLKEYSKLLAIGLGDTDNGVFAGAIIVYFSVLGFMGGYLITRLFLSRVMVTADLSLNPQEKFALMRVDLSLSPRASALNADAQQAAAKILGLPLDQLTDVTDITVWAKAQFAGGSYDKAVAGFQKAVLAAPNDVQLRLEFANALFRANHDPGRIEAQLLEAYRLVRTSTEIDPATKMKVYRALTYHYLFQPPPGGYMSAIKYGLEYLADPDSEKIKSGGILVNLACAYGQDYKFLIAQGESKDSEKARETRNEALMYVELALQVDPKWRERLQQLLRTDITKPQGLNDLEVFEKDPEFRSVLGLPPITQ